MHGGSPGKKRPRCWNDLVSEDSCMSLVESNAPVTKNGFSPCSCDEEPLPGRLVNSLGSVENNAESIGVDAGWRDKCFLHGQPGLGSPVHGDVFLDSSNLAKSRRTMEEAITVPSEHHGSCGRVGGYGHLPWHEELSAAALAARALERVVALQAERSWLRQQLQVGSQLLNERTSQGRQPIAYPRSFCGSVAASCPSIAHPAFHVLHAVQGGQMC